MEAPVSSSLGVMGSLFRRLDVLLAASNDYPGRTLQLPNGVKDGMRCLKVDLEDIGTYLEDLSGVEDPPLTAKCWMKEVRELSYDIEDFMDSVLQSGRIAKTETRSAYKMRHVKITGLPKRKKLKWSKRVTDKIIEFRIRAQDAINRLERYELDCNAFRRRYAPLGPMLPMTYGDGAGLVIDSQMSEFINSLVNDDDQRLKLMSIVGPEGIGKTTLVRVLYNKLGQFECRAFVRMTQRPDIKTVLRDMLTQVQRQKPHDDCLNLISEIRKHLQEKRYLIIIDNLCAASVWDIINHAFPEGSQRSRIVITTQIHDVASACCGYHSEFVFEMKPMDGTCSRKLFFCRIFGSEIDFPKEFKEVSNTIVERCGGLPLATISIASLLASYPVILREQWTHICDSLGSNLGSSSTRIMRILNLSYNNLAHYLKTGLLYLNMYPEGYTISKHDLVEQWVAEGFISEVKGRDMEKVAESYFGELIDRRFLQPACIKYNNEVVSCTVHDMIRDLIAYKSSEDNFVIVRDYYLKNIDVSDNVHRLSLHFGDVKCAKAPGNIRMSKVRSFSFTGMLKCLPSITEFKLLRVLNLQVSCHHGEGTLDLTGISQLFQLRYLKVKGDIFLEIPTHMGGLQYLQTLDLDTKVTAIPWDIIHLQCLYHLHLPFETNLMAWMSSMTSVNVQNHGKLSNLRDLHLTFSTQLPDNLRFEWSSPSCTFSRVPKWIGELGNLCILNIAISELLSDGVDILSGLPALTALSVYVQVRPIERIVFDKVGFSVLKYFKFKCSSVPCLTFEAGGMQNLRKIKLGFNAHRADQQSCPPISIEHLSGLKEISVKIWTADADAGSVLLGAIQNHTRNPTIKVHLVDSMFYSNEGRNMVTEELEHRTLEEQNEFLEEEFNDKLTPDDHSMEEKSKQADKRIATSSKSSSHVQFTGNKTDFIEDAMFSASTGAMNSLEVKLATLVGERYAKFKEMQNKAAILRNDLDSMNTHLEQLAAIPELSIQMKDTRRQMMEVTYNIEDCIDEIMLHCDQDTDQPSTGYIMKLATLQMFSGDIRELTRQMEKAELGSMAQEIEMRTWGSRYSMVRESRLSKTYDNGVDLVGLDGPRNQLVTYLTGSGGEAMHMVCMLGSGGAGKTTLARQVYDTIKCQFERRVFIRLSKKVNIKIVLKDILSQLSWARHYMEMDSYIRKIREILCHKRYLVIIDCIWSFQLLKDIMAALPENNRGSRIITTTCLNDVAESCGNYWPSFVYHMEPLNFEDSLSLFRSVIFGSGRSSPFALEKIAEKIVEACGGLPLAISVIAGVLATRPAEMAEWNMIEKRMKLAGADPHSVDGMRKIIDISYSYLSHDMRTCLLYLSAFPENHVIRKDRLIRRWIAEGFLPKRKEETWWETGEINFLELIARKLIEPVYHYHDGEVAIHCAVQTVIHDFITSLSNEGKFVTWNVPDPACILLQDDVVPRLSMVDWYQNGYSVMNDLCYINLQKVRSLTVFGRVYGVLNLLEFRHLRVLDLKDFWGLEDNQLESIGSLCLLRYLGLRGVNVRKVPKTITALENLLTIDLRQTSVRHLPAITSAKLVSLLADDVELSGGMGEMSELEELSTIHVGNNYSLYDAAEHVNKLKQLRVLGIRFYYRLHATESIRQGMKDFLDEVGKSNLHALTLNGYPHDLLDLLLDCWSHERPRYLQTFELKVSGYVPKVPQEMACLTALTHLDIMASKPVEAEGFCALGNLPNLVLLHLLAKEGTIGRLTVSKNCFQRLKTFCFWCWHGRMGLQFEAGAMPRLQTLRLHIALSETKFRYGDFNFGIQHLNCLVQFNVTISCSGATDLEAVAAEAAIREQMSQTPNNPVLELDRIREGEMYKMKGKSLKSEDQALM